MQKYGRRGSERVTPSFFASSAAADAILPRRLPLALTLAAATPTLRGPLLFGLFDALALRMLRGARSRRHALRNDMRILLSTCALIMLLALAGGCQLFPGEAIVAGTSPL